MQVLCFWTSCALGQEVKKYSSLVTGPRASEFGLQLVAFLADKAVHPIVQVLVITIIG